MVALRISSLLAASTLLTYYVQAYGQIAQVVDADNFCIFLPPADSVDRGIASTEWNAEAFCTGNTPQAVNAGKLSPGFIKSAHFVTTDTYVQVTGQIDPAKGRLDAKDDGGQYDIKAPKGSSCAGWKYYVNLVEPSGNTYCMRCCNDPRTCNRGISEKGCAHIIPGDYSGPYDSKSSGSDGTVATTKKVNTSTTKTSFSTSKLVSSTSKLVSSTAKVVSSTSVAPTVTTIIVSATKNITAVVSSTKKAGSGAAIQTENSQVLSQKDKVVEQSINAADNTQPIMLMTLSAILLAMSMAAQ